MSKSHPEASLLRKKPFPLYHQLAELTEEINNSRLRRRSLSLTTQSSSMRSATSVDQSSLYSRDQSDDEDEPGPYVSSRISMVSVH